MDRARTRAQCVDERLPRWAKAGVFGCAAREYHLDVGARLRGRGRNDCAQWRPTCCCCSTDEKCDTACPHRAMLTYRDGGGDPQNQQWMTPVESTRSMPTRM